VSFALPEALFFTGIDWAAETDAVCVIDAAGKIAAEFTIEHSADGIAALIRRLARYGDQGDMPVAIERPDGRLVDLLLEAGHPVVPVKPNAIKAWRDGEVLPGAKSDAGDAAVIAGYLRLRAHKLTVAVPYSDETRALRTVVRARGDLAGLRVAATNQLSALLETHWPGARAIFADVESPISLEFLTRYPTPAAAAHLGGKRMAAFCIKHGYSGRRSAAELLARLRAAPAGTGLESLAEALRDAVLAAVSVLQALNAAVKNLDRSIAAHLREHPDGAVFTSLPRPGQINAAPGPRRVGRLPPSLRAPRLRRRPRRGHPGHQRIRQAPRRALPLGLQQAVPHRGHHLRRQQPPRQPLGRPDLRQRDRRRQGPPARHPHPGPRLDPRHLPLLARRRPLRPRPARRRRRARRTLD
jgi:transposase